MRLIRDGEKVGDGGVEVGEEGDYIPVATLSPPAHLNAGIILVVTVAIGISLSFFLHLRTFSPHPSPISLTVSVDIKHHVY